MGIGYSSHKKWKRTPHAKETTAGRFEAQIFPRIMTRSTYPLSRPQPVMSCFKMASYFTFLSIFSGFRPHALKRSLSQKQLFAKRCRCLSSCLVSFHNLQRHERSPKKTFCKLDRSFSSSIFLRRYHDFNLSNSELSILLLWSSHLMLLKKWALLKWFTQCVSARCGQLEISIFEFSKLHLVIEHQQIHNFSAKPQLRCATLLQDTEFWSV